LTIRLADVIGNSAQTGGSLLWLGLIVTLAEKRAPK
jgi:hypothetical protein